MNGWSVDRIKARLTEHPFSLPPSHTTGPLQRLVLALPPTNKNFKRIFGGAPAGPITGPRRRSTDLSHGTADAYL
jgi:hypothetical protein